MVHGKKHDHFCMHKRRQRITFDYWQNSINKKRKGVSKNWSTKFGAQEKRRMFRNFRSFSMIARKRIYSDSICTDIPASKLPSFMPPPTLKPEHVFDYNDEVARNEKFVKPSHRTQTHHVIISSLINMSQELKSGRFAGTKGVSSAMLIGSKGIGKSTAMRMFTYFGSALIPGITPLYISFNNPKYSDIAEDAQILGEPLIKAIKNILNLDIHKPLAESLEKENTRLMLMVDELDQLYRCPPDTQEGKVAHITLNDLAWLGNQDTGYISTIICGSSAVLPHLTTCNGTRSEKYMREFPLLSGAPSLNGTKYKSFRAPPSPPIDIDTAGRIITTYLGDKISEVDRRIITFIAGCSSRTVEQVCARSPSMALLAGLLTPEHTEQAAESMSEYRPFLDALLDAMLLKNEKLFAEIHPCSTLDSKTLYDGIATVQWETRFLPLTYEEAANIAAKLTSQKVALNNYSAMEQLNHLSDRSYICFEGVDSGCPQFIYPLSLASLTMRQQARLDKRNYRSKALHAIQGMLSNIRGVGVGGISVNRNVGQNK